MSQITTLASIALNALALRQPRTAGQGFGISATLRWALAIVTAATLAGCGGGGSSAEPTTTGTASPHLAPPPPARRWARRSAN